MLAGTLPFSDAETVPHRDPFSSEALREFRELLMQKYRLHVLLFNAMFGANRSAIEEVKARAAGATVDMFKAVQRWMSLREQWTPEEWQLVNKIYLRVNQLYDAEKGGLLLFWEISE